MLRKFQPHFEGLLRKFLIKKTTLKNPTKNDIIKYIINIYKRYYLYILATFLVW